MGNVLLFRVSAYKDRVCEVFFRFGKIVLFLKLNYFIVRLFLLSVYVTKMRYIITVSVEQVCSTHLCLCLFLTASQHVTEKNKNIMLHCTV